MPLWIAPQPLVLASKSDIRGKLLAASGLRFGIRAAQIDERAVERDANVSDAQAAARLLAEAKAKAVSAQMPGHIVLGADQTQARRAAPTNCIPASPWCATVKCCSTWSTPHG